MSGKKTEQLSFEQKLDRLEEMGVLGFHVRDEEGWTLVLNGRGA